MKNNREKIVIKTSAISITLDVDISDQYYGVEIYEKNKIQFTNNIITIYDCRMFS